MIEQMYPYKILFVEDENAIRENYITYLKTYFVNKAIEDYNIEGLVAWWDFGFNHGGELGILDPNDFDFKWKYNFTDKVTQG